MRPKTLRAAPEDVDHDLSITLARIGHARHEPQASGAVSLLSAIATALSTAATAALEVVVVRPALVALLDEGLRAAGHVVEHRAHSLRRVLVVELLHDVLHRKRRVEALRVALRDRQERRIELLH